MSEVRASHILIKHRDSRRPSSWKEPTVTRTKAQAVEELRAIQDRLAGGESFEQIASVESHCSSAKQGGDLGAFGRGMMMKPFEDATYVLGIGEVSGIVETDSGVHLVKRTG
eukprot:Plantae.Rhodophyta-Purpureofilum_apyrenoidigerum.ctg63272.p1 GENE.Plantae.Rhodophyta-Purpureofilum_apyrenoidigerum.ctg63272~~Plantae.Rhodophyta-Purpureofilum_apyrenoidigerum.ctg63272.p1  ORF type:complete len:112 (-),score=20.40 Plantae.Rhodophyta-Purpureofilum_apyrenoidigerum.ctg63272:276-611(-)